MTDDLAAFVLARVGDMEADAVRAERQREGGGLWVVTGMDNAVGVDYEPAFVLAWCAAVRQVVELHVAASPADGFGASTSDCHSCYQETYDPRDPIERAVYPCDTIRALASMWRDHEDYRAEEWA